MNFEHFLTKKIINSSNHKNTISSPIIKIGIGTISLGLVFMILTFAIGNGMQKEIKEKISTLEGHITVQSFNNNINQNSKNPISPSDVFIDATIDIPSVNRIEKIISSFGIVRTKTDFHGCYFKGVNHSYNWSGIEKYVLEGRVPNINDSTFSNEILIPKIIANKLKLDINDRIQMIFSRENSNPSLIQLEVSGIYSTGFDDLDSKYIFGDIDHLIRINKWDSESIGHLEIHLDEFKYIDNVSTEIYSNSPSDYDVVNINSKYFSIFEWIKLFDKNILLIFSIIVIISSINIISILLILVLERTKMVGLFKALGARNVLIRKYFILNTFILLTRGLFIGNIVALVLIFVQHFFKIIKLDSTIYFVKSVPVNIEFHHFLVINILVILTCVLSLILPSMIVSKINPKDSIKFE